MVVKPSQLRANLYRLLARVLRTGEPIEIERAGKKLMIVPKEKESRLQNLVHRDVIVGDPEDLVHPDWSKEWPVVYLDTHVVVTKDRLIRRHFKDAVW